MLATIQNLEDKCSRMQAAHADTLAKTRARKQTQLDEIEKRVKMTLDRKVKHVSDLQQALMAMETRAIQAENLLDNLNAGLQFVPTTTTTGFVRPTRDDALRKSGELSVQ